MRGRIRDSRGTHQGVAPGAKKEEDPEKGVNHTGAGKSWSEFVELCSSVWVTGTIPQ